MAGDITSILARWNTDKNGAIEELTPLVYNELHKIAASYLRRAQPDHTLQATALINEAYLRMVKQEAAGFQDRAHFFALAARIMRSILVDFARARASQKRGSGGKVQLDRDVALSADGAERFLAIHDALDKLKAFDERKAQVIELRYFGGLNFEEIADALGISLVTARRDAAFSEAWLRRLLSGGE